jgi:glycosyltransferase domain-containing protein
MNDLEFFPKKNSNFELLKKCTLVIPTSNRNFYLSRCLWYHSHFPFSTIIVADSSNVEKKKINHEIIKGYPQINIIHLEFLPETEEFGGDIIDKWANAVTHVNTEYTVICTDKEFLIPETMCYGINFLDNNYDYSHVNGQHLYINSDSTGKLQFNNPFPSPLSFNSSDPTERLISFLLESASPVSLLTLGRTKMIQRWYQILHESNVHDLRFGELFLCIIPSILSKHCFFPNMVDRFRDISFLHDLSGNVKPSESSGFRYPLFSGQIKAKIYYDNFEKFIQGVALQLSLMSMHSLEECQNIIIPLFLGFVRRRGFFDDFFRNSFIDTIKKFKEVSEISLSPITKMDFKGGILLTIIGILSLRDTLLDLFLVNITILANGIHYSCFCSRRILKRVFSRKGKKCKHMQTEFDKIHLIIKKTRDGIQDDLPIDTFKLNKGN